MKFVKPKMRPLIVKGIFDYTESYEKKNKDSGRRWGTIKKVKSLGKQMEKRMAMLNKIRGEELEAVQYEELELAGLEKQIKNIR